MAQLRGKFMFVMVGGAPTEDVVGQSLFSNAPSRYAEALERGTAKLIFPSLLIKKAPAGADPRLLQLCTPKTVTFPLPFGLPSMAFTGCQGQGNYPTPQVARWNVVFDMESGYLPSSPTVANRTISAERIRWMRQQNYLIFVTHGHPATPCSAGDAACQRRLTSVTCPTTSTTCLTQWSKAGAAYKVDIVGGRTTLNALAADYKINVVDTDQERLGVFDPRPVTVGDGDSRWDPLTVPSAAAGSPFAPVVATWGGGRVELFARLNNSLWWRSFGPRGWSAWTNLGGTITSDPAAIAYDDGSLYVWAIGPDQVPVAIRRVDNVWSSWQRLNRSDRMLAIGARALGDSAQLFARGTDSMLYRTSVLLQSGSAPPWQVIDGHVIHSAPRSISAGDPSADVYALGGTVLGHVVLTGNGPLPWEGLYPAATGAGVARAADNTIEVFFGAAGGSVLRLRWNGALWRLFGQDGVTTTTDPGVVAWSTGDVDVYVRSADGEIYHRRFDGRLGV
jgi:hypothetical protein